jgi:hypothetical protein
MQKEINMVSLLESAYMAIAFVVFVIVVAIGGSVLSSVQASQTTDGVAYNATKSGLTGITNLAAQSGTIGTILGAVIIIGLLLGAFVMGRK